VPIPPPEVGLVIRYNYLWRREADRQRSQSKDRPACIVAAIADTVDRMDVVLLPITRAPPKDDVPAVELPPKVKEHLGLDPDRSWVIVAECNVDVWPSPDLAEIPGRPGRYAYGHLPPRLFRRIRDAFVDRARAKRVRFTRRQTSTPNSQGRKP
jgi:hypothetical protein